MKTELIKGSAIVGKQVEFTTRELEQMAEMQNKVEKVINSHRTPNQNQKRIYLSDEDLLRIEAILMCILETECEVATTVFDEYVETMRKVRAESKGSDNDIDKPAV